MLQNRCHLCLFIRVFRYFLIGRGLCNMKPLLPFSFSMLMLRFNSLRLFISAIWSTNRLLLPIVIILCHCVGFLNGLIGHGNRVEYLSLIGLVLSRMGRFHRIRVGLTMTFTIKRIAMIFRFRRVMFNGRDVRRVFTRVRIMVPLNTLFHTRIVLCLGTIRCLGRLVLHLTIRNMYCARIKYPWAMWHHFGNILCQVLCLLTILFNSVCQALITRRRVGLLLNRFSLRLNSFVPRSLAGVISKRPTITRRVFRL